MLYDFLDQRNIYQIKYYLNKEKVHENLFTFFCPYDEE